MAAMLQPTSAARPEPAAAAGEVVTDGVPCERKSKHSIKLKS